MQALFIRFACLGRILFFIRSSLRLSFLLVATTALTVPQVGAESVTGTVHVASGEARVPTEFRDSPKADRLLWQQPADHAKRIEAPDINASKPGPRHIGVVRMLARTNVGGWTQAADGAWIAHIAGHSQSAAALRLGVRANMPLARIELRSRSVTGVTETVLVRQDIAAGEILYTPETRGDRQVAEISVFTDSPPGDGTFDFISVVHHWTHSADAEAFEPRAKNAEACHIDVACRIANDAQLQNTSRAVVQMTFVSGSDSAVCTGTIINAIGSAAGRPWLLTANHCLETQAVASTLQARFFYRRAACGFNLSPAAAVTVTSGATLIATDAAMDGTLLLLRDALPTEVFRAGWESGTLAFDNSAMTGIHHPAGDVQKFSRGTGQRFDAGTAVAKGGSMINIRWQDGVTQGGSSGSGLFTPNSQGQYLLRGMLSGGGATCSTPTELDEYGRFDHFYRKIRSAINPDSAAAFLEATPPSVAFGEGTVGQTSAARTITLRNIGRTPVTGLAITPDADAALAFTGDSTCGATLAVGATCTITGSFAPTTRGVKRGNIQVTATDLAPYALFLHGTGVGPSPVILQTVRNGTGSGRVSQTSGNAPVSGNLDCAGNTCTANYLQGATIKLVASPAAGSAFAGWSGACAGTDAECSLTMEGVKQAVATFNSACDATIATGDCDADGLPNGIEATEGRNPQVKDNDVFTSARLFAMQQFRDFLGREGDAAGIGFWAGELTSGRQSRASMVDTFLSSEEYRNLIAPVTRLYFASFLRIPDYGGLRFWVGEFAAGRRSYDNIANEFALSPEFVQTYGALSDSQFVERVYLNILGRSTAGDPAGAAFWLTEITSGRRTRGQVLGGFSASAEYQTSNANRILVVSLYAAMARRAPTQAEFNADVDALTRGTLNQRGLLQRALDSAEYRRRFLP
jgi:lysyl endopeptidase